MTLTKCSWDEVISDELHKEWKNVTTALNDVSPYFEFSRKSVNASDAAEFIIFKYASLEFYGFVIYCCQNYKSNIIFSKIKVAPEPNKMLPTL